ncbi:hypothetical protein AZKH_1389 [Azoarcus sp. KH32C]|nr:hypothetical protein AZKH_1389 [Azoarcus sp. KH32C]
MRVYRALLTATLMCLTDLAPAGIYSGRVVAIADGDTLTVRDTANVQHKVRLSGIDAPEKRQPFGNVSRQHLAELVFGRYVAIEYHKVDRYGRELGKVLVADRDANLAQIRAGLAWHYKRYEGEQPSRDRAEYSDAETEARVARRGLWHDSTPVAPWDFRRH